MEIMSREMMISIEASSIFPGFRFSPTDSELISYYLKRKMEGHEKSVEVIPEVEIYKFEPWDLPGQTIIKSDGEWFFFCARGRKYPHGSQSKRATELGYWKATGKERNVKLGSEVIGTKRTLVFHIGRAPKGERTEWIMHEYRMTGMPQDALVVCRLRRNAEFRASSSQKQASNLQEALCSDQTCVSELEKTAESYSQAESEHKRSSDVAESSNRHQDSDEDDFYAEILKQDIIKLDETRVLAPPLLVPASKQLGVANQTVEPKTARHGIVRVRTHGGSNGENAVRKLDSKRKQRSKLPGIFLGVTVLLVWFVTLLGILRPMKKLGFGN